MKNWTGQEILETREQLERTAETLLGKFVLAYGHFEKELALLVVWSNDGRDIKKLTAAIGEDPWHAKLCRFEKLASKKYAAQQNIWSKFESWLSDAHAVRIQRNQFLHGRWGIDPVHNHIVNAVGIPTSPDQREIPYTPSQLQENLTKIQELQSQMHALCRKWPL
jgi:hypothetical protein